MMHISREQDLALVQALEHGGPSQAVCPGSEDLWEWSTAACRWFLTPAGKLLAQAIKDRDDWEHIATNERERRSAFRRGLNKTKADAWDEGFQAGGDVAASAAMGKALSIRNPYRKDGE